MPRKIDDPWGRAEILLDAMSRMDGTDTHVHDWPAAVIRDLMADIMHYCARRNEASSLARSITLTRIRSSSKPRSSSFQN